MVKSWHSDARQAFEAYPWPSNAEKRRAAAECESVCCGNTVMFQDLPSCVRTRQVPISDMPATDVIGQMIWRGESWEKLKESFTKQILSQVMEHANGNVTAAARLLKTTPRLVAYQCRKFGINKLNLKSRRK